MKKIASFVALLMLAGAASAAPLRVLSWNVESGGADPAVIAEQMVALGRADVYCLQEVAWRDVLRYADAIRRDHGEAYRFITSNTGGKDRLAVLYDAERLTLLEVRELFRHGDYVLNGWRHRSPLVLVLRDRETGVEFNVMTVHLARGSRRMRREQAAGLREWAKSEGRPTLLVGDCNFDFNFVEGRGNEAFEIFQQGGVWRWVKPAEQVDSNWDDRDGDGLDNYPDSMLDFAFVSGEGLNGVTSRVIVREGDFPDDDRTSDHRPLEARVAELAE